MHDKFNAQKGVTTYGMTKWAEFILHPRLLHTIRPYSGTAMYICLAM